MTTEEILQKAGELSQREGGKVHPLIFMGESDEKIVGYLKEPPRHVKLRVMDKGLTAPATAAAEVVDAFLIKEESDQRIWDEKPENDRYYLGATMEAYNLISMAVNQLKKK
jgi:hypothetical protein